LQTFPKNSKGKDIVNEAIIILLLKSKKRKEDNNPMNTEAKIINKTAERDAAAY
jgi:hypothetical protein